MAQNLEKHNFAEYIKLIPPFSKILIKVFISLTCFTNLMGQPIKKFLCKNLYCNYYNQYWVPTVSTRSVIRHLPGQISCLSGSSEVGSDRFSDQTIRREPAIYVCWTVKVTMMLDYVYSIT